MNSKIGAGMVRAIKRPANVIALSLALAGSVLFLTSLPLAIGLAGETIYLIFVVIRTFGLHSQAAAGTLLAESLPQGAAPASEPALSHAARAVKLTPSATEDLRPDLQVQCATIDSLTRVIALKVGATTSFARELTLKLDMLRTRHAQFCRREMQLRSMLRHLVEEARTTRTGGDLLPRTPEALMPSAQLVLSPAPSPPNQTAGEYAQDMARQAHAEFERALSEIAWQRESFRLAHSDPSELDRTSLALIKRNRYVDRVSKTLINLNYEIQLIVRKFEEIRIEVGDGSVEQILGDLNALLLQADSVNRTLEDLEPINQKGDAVGV